MVSKYLQNIMYSLLNKQSSCCKYIGKGEQHQKELDR